MIINIKKYKTTAVVALMLTFAFIVAVTPNISAAEAITAEVDPMEEEIDDGSNEVGTLSFNDVPDDHRLFDAIKFCVDEGYMRGYSSEEFGPNDNVTRGQFAAVWARTFNVRKHNFQDATKTADEFDNAIVIMYGIGYFNGMSPTEFMPEEHTTREQALTIVARTHLEDVDGENMYENFSDSEDVSEWARDGVSACYKNGLLEGVFEGEALMPQEALTRAELCQIIYNIMEEK